MQYVTVPTGKIVDGKRELVREAYNPARRQKRASGLTGRQWVKARKAARREASREHLAKAA